MAAISAAVKTVAVAATFCSRCSVEDVPGMGSIQGDRDKSQESAAWCSLI
jgi:hypothetical protein